MKDTEFCYWLQGYFELAEPKELTANTVAMIHKHLDLVLAKTDDEIKIPYIYWLEGILTIRTKGGMNNSEMNIIIKRLQKVFKHVIDPYTSDEL